nr:NfeD family protein [uncultured Merdimonas sp.]
MQTIYWLVLFVILLVIEIFTMGLTTIWFAGGALAAFLAGVLGFGLAVQIVVFLVVSVLLLVLTRPIAVKYFNKERQKTNAESLIGQQGLVVEDIDTIHAKGVVEVKGQEWSAKTDEPDGKIAKNTVVIIDGIQGVHLIVRAREEKTC